MINMKLHCLAVRSAPGERCGELIWRTGCVLNGTLPSEPGGKASCARAGNQCRDRTTDRGGANKGPFGAGGRSWEKGHLKLVWFDRVQLYPESN